MLQIEIVERIKRLPFAGVISDENRFSSGYLVSLMNTARAQILRDVYQKNNKRLNPVAYQKHYPVFSHDLQESSTFVKFECPEVITLDSNSDGLRYIGTIDCTTAFRRIWTRSMLSTINKHEVMSVANNRYTAALYDGAAQMVEVYGNPEIEELLIEAVFMTPTEVPTWNPDKDNYPFPDDLVPMLEEYIFKNITSIEAAVEPEVRNQYNQATARQRRR
jgi:hypothetical protein